MNKVLLYILAMLIFLSPVLMIMHWIYVGY